MAESDPITLTEEESSLLVLLLSDVTMFDESAGPSGGREHWDNVRWNLREKIKKARGE